MEHVWWGLGLLVVALTTLVLAHVARVPLGWLPVTAILRATVQLAAVALILRGVLAVPWTVALFVLLMVTTATWTAGGRLSGLPGGRRIALLGVVAGAALSLVLVFTLRLVDLEARYVVAVGGIVIGNAMSAATLSGRTFLRDARARRDEVEAWLSLGATPAQAYDDVGPHRRPRGAAAHPRPDPLHRPGDPPRGVRGSAVRRRDPAWWRPSSSSSCWPGSP